jgi:HEAT repeats
MAIDQRLIQQLSSEDPKERRKAVIALADSRNPDALRLLDESAKMDPERKVREVAERAFKHLKEQTDRAANPSAVKPVVIPEKQVQRAHQYVEEAMSAYIGKDEALATRSLTKALQLNPNLKTDQYFLSMVSNVLNMDPQEGLAVLVSGDKRGEFIEKAKSQKIRQHKDEHKAQTKELGWDALAFDLGVYGLVITAIAFLAPFVVSQLVAKTVAYQAALTPEKFDAESVKISAELANSLTVQPLTALLGALGSGIIGVLVMFILGFLVHQLATRLLKGNGTMVFMMSQLVPFYSFMTPIFFIWSCILLGMVSVGAGTFSLLCLPIMGLGSLVVFFKAAGRIGKAYDFGALKGCLSLIIASFALSLVAGLISSIAFGSALSAAMASIPR